MSRLQSIIDHLIKEVGILFKQFLLAFTLNNLGHSVIDDLDNDVRVETIVGLNISIEPVPIHALREFKGEITDFILEVFHGKLIQRWNETLSSLLQYLVDLHFSGKRPFKELKRKALRCDFTSAAPIEEQIKESIIKDFDFDKYSERVKLINGVFDPNNDHDNDLKVIHKHVQIRNSIQHKDGIIDEFFLKELGIDRIVLLDDDGREKEYGQGDRLKLSIPEVDYFRRSMLTVSQCWRRSNV